ncbi:MAG: hypothetical protein HUU54_13310 [Ignavibacteriaceae bacterium]|nr:hypothetical protein [Ignavibacteriaceae bacterium]
MKKFFIVILVNLLFSGLYAQGGGSTGAADAWSTSTGKTYTVLAKGLYAIGKNPANLYLTEAKRWEVSSHFPLPNVHMRVGTDFLSLNEYNYFFGGEPGPNGETQGRYLTESDKERLLNVFEGGGMIFADIALSNLAVAYKLNNNKGVLAFTMNDYMMQKFNIPAGMIDLFVSGNPPNKTYDFNDLDVKISYLREYTFSFARDLNFMKPKFVKNLYGGVTLKYMQGMAYAGVDEMNTNFTTQPDGILTGQSRMRILTAFSDNVGVEYDFDSTAEKKNFTFSLFPKPVGSGFGIDFGLTAEIGDRWKIGLAFTDIGSMTWSQNVAEYISYHDFTITEIIDPIQRDSLVTFLKGEGRYTSAFTKPLPTAFRLGASFLVWKNDFKYFLLSMDYNQGFNNEPRNSTSPRISIGGEWNQTKWLPYMRGGFSFGGDSPFIWSVGIGFNWGPVEFNLATPDFHYIFIPGDAQRIAFATSARWKF